MIFAFCILQRGFDLPTQDRKAGDIAIYGSNGVIGYHNEARVEGPCVITGRSGSLGDVMYVNNDCWALNTSLYIREFYENSRKFVYYFLIHFDLSRFGTGTGVPTLNRNDVHLVKIAIPPKEEQVKIAHILSQLDQRIRKTESKLISISNIKKALMQDLLTGRVRVQVDAA